MNRINKVWQNFKQFSWFLTNNKKNSLIIFGTQFQNFHNPKQNKLQFLNMG
jgi:hypothetical protein